MRRALAALPVAFVLAAGLAVGHNPANAVTATPTTPTETAYPVVWVNNDVYSKSVVGIADGDRYGNCLTFPGPSTGCMILGINHAYQDGMPSAVRGFYSGRGASVDRWYWGTDQFSSTNAWRYLGCVTGPVWQTLDYRWMTVRAFAGGCYGRAAHAAPTTVPN